MKEFCVYVIQSSATERLCMTARYLLELKMLSTPQVHLTVVVIHRSIEPVALRCVHALLFKCVHLGLCTCARVGVHSAGVNNVWHSY